MSIKHIRRKAEITNSGYSIMSRQMNDLNDKVAKGKYNIAEDDLQDAVKLYVSISGSNDAWAYAESVATTYGKSGLYRELEKWQYYFASLSTVQAYLLALLECDPEDADTQSMLADNETSLNEVELKLVWWTYVIAVMNLPNKEGKKLNKKTQALLDLYIDKLDESGKYDERKTAINKLSKIMNKMNGKCNE